jgi:hydroxypyruvate isomerase
MPRFAANLSMMYPELPFLDRFEAAAKDGFKAVEYLFPYAFAKEELVERLQANNLQQVLFNAPPGGTDARPPLTGPGTAATKASPASRGARMNFVPVWRWRWTMRRRWAARAST